MATSYTSGDVTARRIRNAAELSRLSTGTNALEVYRRVAEETAGGAQSAAPEENDTGKAGRIGATILDVQSSIGKGAWRSVEGIADFLIGLAGTGIIGGGALLPARVVTNLLTDGGWDEKIKQIMEFDVTGAAYDVYKRGVKSVTGIDVTQDSYQSGNRVGETLRKVEEGVGGMLPAVAASVATAGAYTAAGAAASVAAKAGEVASLATLGAGAAGQAAQEAYGEGASLDRGMAYGAVSGAVEIGSEKLFGGVGKAVYGTGMLDAVVPSVAKTGWKRVAANFVEEGAEEVVSDLVNPIAKTIYKGKDALSEYGTGEYWRGMGESFLVGGLTATAYAGTVGYGLSRFGVGHVGKEADVESLLEDIEGLARKEKNARVHGKLTDALSERIQRETAARYADIGKILEGTKDSRRSRMIRDFSLDKAFDADGKLNRGFGEELGLYKKTAAGEAADTGNLRAQYFSGRRGNVAEALRTAQVSPVQSLNEAETAGYKAFLRMADRLDGLTEGKFSFAIVEPDTDSGRNAEGFYVRDRGVVLLSRETLANPAATAEALRDSWFGVTLEESMHMANESAGDAYLAMYELLGDGQADVIRSLVRDGYFADTWKNESEMKKAVDRLLHKKTENMTQSEKARYDALLDEIVAHLARNELATKHFYNRMIQENRPFAERLLEKLRAFRRAVSGQKGTAESDAVQSELTARAAAAEELFLQAMQEVGAHVEGNRIVSPDADREDEYEQGEIPQNSKTDEGNVRFSIREITGASGRKYGTGVYLDSVLLTDLSPAERIRTMQARVREFGGRTILAVDQSGETSKIRIADVSDKYVKDSGKSRKVNHDLMTKNRQDTTRQEIVVLLDEAIIVSGNRETAGNTHSHGWIDNYGKNDWEYWKIYVQDRSGSIWSARLNVTTADTGEKYLYDVDKVKEVEKGDQSPVSHTSSEKADAKSSASLPSSKLNKRDVNSPTSLSSSKLNERDAEAPALSTDSIAQEIDSVNTLGKNNQENLRMAIKHGKEDLSQVNSQLAEEAEQRVTQNLDELRDGKVPENIQNAAAGGTESAADARSRSVTITSDDIAKLKRIGKKSVNDFNAEEIRTTGKWMRKSWTELQEKSPFFRSLFGDWRAYDTARRRSVSVKLIPEFKESDAAGLIQDGIKSGTLFKGSVKNTDTGFFLNIGSRAYQDSLAYAQRKYGDGKAAEQLSDLVASLYSMKSIGRSAVLLDTETSNSGNPESSFLHRFYALADTGKKTLLVRLTVEELNAGSGDGRTQAYNVKGIEVSPDAVPQVNRSAEVQGTASAYSVADLFAIVKSHNRDFRPKEADRRLLNRDGTPKKAYTEASRVRERIADAKQEAEGRNRLARKLNTAWAKAQRIREWKSGEFRAAGEPGNADMLKVLGTLSKINQRGNFSATSTRKVMGTVAEWYAQPEVQRALGAKFTEGAATDGGFWKAEILEKMTRLQDGRDADNPDTRRVQFTEADADDLNDILDHVRKIVEEAHYVRVGNRMVKAREAAEVYERKLRENGRRFHATMPGLVFERYRLEFNDPASVMRYYDGYVEHGFLQDMHAEMRESELNADIIRTGMMQQLVAFEKEHPKYFTEAAKPDRTVNIHGADIQLMQALYIALALEREQAIPHLMRGGFRYLDRKGKSVRTGELMSISKDTTADMMKAKAEEMHADILSQVSGTDRAFLALTRKLFNEDCKSYKRETDLRRFGYTNVLEGAYVPIQIADKVIRADTADYRVEIDRATNASFNKNTVDNASNAIVAGNLLQVLTRHIDGIARYAGLSEFIQTYETLLNIDINKPQAVTEDGAPAVGKPAPRSVRQALESVWPATGKTEGAATYLNRMLENVQRIRVSDKPSMVVQAAEWARGKAAVAVLGANPKVIATQFSSLFAAASVLKPEYILRGMTMRANQTDIDTYCKLAYQRRIGNDAVRAQGILDNISKVGEFCTALIGKTDSYVVSRLWNACLLQAAEQTHAAIDSEVCKTAAGTLLKTVIYETQQNAQMTERSAAMRSDNPINRIVTMFSADSMKILGRVIDASGMYRAAKMQGNADAKARAGVQFRRAVGSFATQALYMAVVATLFRKLLAYDDDDTLKDWSEGDILSFFGDLFSSMVGGLPIIKEATEFFSSGYDIEDMGVGALNDLLSGIRNVAELPVEAMSGTLTDEQAATRVRSLLYSLGQMTGIPIRNVYKYSRGVLKIADDVSGSHLVYRMDSAFGQTSLSRDLAAAVEGGDQQKAAFIAGLALDQRVDLAENADVRQEIVRLAAAGETVLPRSVGNSVTYDGETYRLTARQSKRFATVYGGAGEASARMVGSSYYQAASDAVKAKALRRTYETYYNLAIEDLLGVELEEKAVLFSKAIPAEKLAVIAAASSEITADTDRSGNPITGSRRAKLVAWIEKLRLNAAQKYMLLAYLGYAPRGGREQVRRYVESLPLKKEVRDKLFGLCGYE